MLTKPNLIPKKPGVYMFCAKNGKILYVGKAVNLQSRLSSYFSKNAPWKARYLLKQSHSLKWTECLSEPEALIQESLLIKRYLPRFNVLMRDDKNYFYVGITDDEFPKVFLTHQPVSQTSSYVDQESSAGSKRRGKIKSSQITYIGPYTSGVAIKRVLSMIQKIFPYCTCRALHKNKCINAQIGRCFGFCCSSSYKAGSEDKKKYQDNIRKLKLLLTGKRKKLISALKQKMKDCANRNEFEQAALLRDQIAGIENIFSHSSSIALMRRGNLLFQWEKVGRELKELLGVRKSISRVEAYDISNLSGRWAVGSMVVFVDGLPAKSEYRKFRIKTISELDDYAMLKEVLMRRISHSEWKYPDLFVIDGGKGQLSAALDAAAEIKKEGFEIKDFKFAALAKKNEELYIQGSNSPILLRQLPLQVMHFFQHIRDEAHRFAKKYHRQLRKAGYQ